ncbi:hypothetical protein [Nonomuraea sp. NPDC049309]
MLSALGVLLAPGVLSTPGASRAQVCSSHPAPGEGFGVIVLPGR